jgi:hypothetical protein
LLLFCIKRGRDADRALKAVNEGFAPWLSGSDPAVDPGIDAAVQITPVSPKMNKPSYNEPGCIKPLVSA